MDQPHSKLWAKSAYKGRAETEGENLLAHSINTAIVAKAVCSRLPFLLDERIALE